MAWPGVEVLVILGLLESKQGGAAGWRRSGYGWPQNTLACAGMPAKKQTAMLTQAMTAILIGVLYRTAAHRAPPSCTGGRIGFFPNVHGRKKLWFLKAPRTHSQHPDSGLQ